MTGMLPRPPKLLIGASVCVIAGSGFFFAAFIAACVDEVNPFAIMGGVGFLPLVMGMAIQQYRGTFLRIPSAARTAAVMLYIVAGLVALPILVGLGEAVAEGVSVGLMGTGVVRMAVFGITVFFLGRMNGRWSRRLGAAVEVEGVKSESGGWSLRGVLVCVGVGVAVTGLTWYLIETTPPRRAEHVERSAVPFSLPYDARDISYCRGARGTIWYEFKIGERGFREWVESGIGSIESESAGSIMQEIDEAVTMMRFNVFSLDPNDPSDITISNGLYYAWSKEDRGVYAAFDRAAGRAYYYAHFH